MVREEADIIDKLITDLNEIHEQTDLRIDELDDKVYKAIPLVQKGIVNLDALKDLRLNLWIRYTEESIIEIEEFVKELSLRLVKVSQYKSSVNKIRRNFDKINNELNDFKILEKSNYFEDLIKLFQDSVNLWNDLVDNEEDLKREAWFKFLSLIYLPFCAFVSAVYWTIIKFFLESKDILGVVTIFWFFLLYLLYFFLFRWARNPFKIYDEEEY